MRLNSFFVFFLFLIAVPVSAQEFTQQSFARTNSGYDEQAPVVSPDGQTLYITIARHPQNIGGKRDLGDIWISTRIGSEWSTPVHGGNVLNDLGYNAVAGVSGDGGRLYLLSHYAQSGRAQTQGIAVSRKTSAGWSAPQNISIPYFLNKAPELTGHVTDDESSFVFAAESYGTLGAEDIYVSTKNTYGTWSEPINLGGVINTSMQEKSPWLSADGRRLYFASNGRKGFGSFDVYYSDRLDDSWTKWTPPVNMGREVNSVSRELFYSDYAGMSQSLYTSTFNSDGYGVIKFFSPPKPADSVVAKLPNVTAKMEPRKDSIITAKEIVKNETPLNGKSIVLVKGKISNLKSQVPIQANIHYQSDSSWIASSDVSGLYEINLPSVKQYIIKVDAPGYVSAIEKLDLRTLEMRELEMNFKLQPIEVGTTVNLKNVLFQQSTANLLPESSDELDMVADFLKTNPKVAIELAGHTDNRGIHSHNMKLSKERVDKVKEYLVKKGVEPSRISGKGYGGSRPIAENDAEDTRKLNRRVEFTIVKN